MCLSFSFCAGDCVWLFLFSFFDSLSSFLKDFVETRGDVAPHTSEALGLARSSSLPESFIVFDTLGVSLLLSVHLFSSLDLHSISAACTASGSLGRSRSTCSEFAYTGRAS